MEVILLEDVKNVGKKGDVVKVNDGYARNVLIKKKLGLEATGKNLNDLKLRKANDDKIAAENLEAAKELGTKIENSKIIIPIKMGSGGKSFVQLKDAIKTTGEYDVKIKLHPKVTASLKVIVEGKE